MTARAVIPPATLRAAALEAKSHGVVVTITMPDGTVCTVAPATERLDHTDADQIKWGAK